MIDDEVGVSYKGCCKTRAHEGHSEGLPVYCGATYQTDLEDPLGSLGPSPFRAAFEGMAASLKVQVENYVEYVKFVIDVLKVQGEPKEQRHASLVLALINEAWDGKIIKSLDDGTDGALLTSTPTHVVPSRLEHYEDVVHSLEQTIGAVFVRKMSDSSAMMIGIHRLRGPSGIVDELIEKVLEWCGANQVAILYVCPYHSMEQRLLQYGFASCERPDDLSFGDIDLDDVCDDPQGFMCKVFLDTHIPNPSPPNLLSKHALAPHVCRTRPQRNP